MEGQKLQDTERTNEVGYGWMNLGSLLLGLTAWGIPAVYFSRRKPGGDRAGLACLLSMAACAGALFLQVLYNKHLVELQDWSALMDTSGAVAWVSVLLLAVTLILDLFCLWAEGKLNEEERGKGGPEEPEIRREGVEAALLPPIPRRRSHEQREKDGQQPRGTAEDSRRPVSGRRLFLSRDAALRAGPARKNRVQLFHPPSYT